MIYKVIIDGRTFEVNIDDLNSRPIIAVVDGEPIEVWPQAESGVTAPSIIADRTGSAALANQIILQNPPGGGSMAKTNGNNNPELKVVHSPLPGVVISVAIQPDDEVVSGQVLLVLEAMKMKNTIRAGRSGVVKTIHVLPGQAVQHHDLLLEYAD